MRPNDSTNVVREGVALDGRFMVITATPSFTSAKRSSVPVSRASHGARTTNRTPPISATGPSLFGRPGNLGCQPEFGNAFGPDTSHAETNLKDWPAGSSRS